MLRVLLVDDNPDDRLLVKRHLSSEFSNIQYIEVTNDAQFEDVLSNQGFDLVVTDYQLNWSNGIDVLNRIRKRLPDMPVIMFTGTGSEEVAVEAMKLGLDDYILKSNKHAKKLPVAVKSVLEKKQTQREKRQLYDTLVTVFNQTPEGIFLLNNDNIIALTNQIADEYLLLIEGKKRGDTLKTLAGKPIEHYFVSPPNIIWHEITISKPAKRIFEVGGRYIISEGIPFGTVFIIRDVTEERKTAEKLLSQERLAAIGQLAAGIAHDFNNILTGIIGYAEILSFDENLPYEIKKRIDIILRSGHRAAELVKQILDFSRKSITSKTTFDLIPYLKEFVKFISRTLPENIQIDFRSDPKKCPIKADPTKIQQVLTNLVVNAKDAMPEGGTITITAREKYIVDDKPFSEMTTGKWVEIMVKDTGTGIPKDVLPHIFEPFFTTKGVGKGTGLGLSQAYGIVKQHDGFIEVKTEEGKYTAFYVYLPITDTEAAEELKPKEPPIPEGSGEKILVVEDDESVRTLAINLLNEINYQVEVAATAQEALQILRHKGEEFNLVISDLVIPDLNGPELCKKIKEIVPGIPVIAMSGYPLIEEDKKTILEHFDSFLQKPFSIKSLAETVKNSLHRE